MRRPKMLSMTPKWLAQLLANDSFDSLMDLDLLHVKPSNQPGMTMGQRQESFESNKTWYVIQACRPCDLPLGRFRAS